ncbi:MAG: ABC transporter permease [Mycoplasma sp.]|nr:ABC transporter permease [Mycoplasma sp.]
MSNFLRIKSDQFIFGKSARKNRKNTLFITLFIILALFLGLIVLQIFGYDFGRSFVQMFDFPFSEFLYKDFLQNFATLGMAGLAFIVAYKSGLFNIGISGQMMGAGLAVVGMVKNAGWTDSGPIGDASIILTLIVAVLAGAFVALISGVLKTLFNINEVVSAILINWIIFFLLKYLLQSPDYFINYDNSLVSSTIAPNMSIYNESLFSGFVGALIIFFVSTLLIWFIFKFTVFGKKIKAIGLSKDASAYSGYKTKSLQLSAFAMSGAVAGLLAVIVYTGTYDRAIPLPQTNVIPSNGFDGIAVALIAFNNPIALIPITFFLSIIKTASASAPPYPSSFGDMVMGFVMYGSAIFVLVYRYRPINWLKAKLSKKVKYERNYWIRQYSDDNNLYINQIEQLLSERKLNIFLETQKTISKSLNVFSRLTLKKEIVNKFNKEYILKTKTLKENKISLFQSFKKQINITKDEGGEK